MWFFSVFIRNWLMGSSTWRGSSTFTTTVTSKVVSMPGVKSTDIGFAIAAVAPGAGEQLGVTTATDQITVFRLTGTTSALAFNYFVIR